MAIRGPSVEEIFTSKGTGTGCFLFQGCARLAPTVFHSPLLPSPFSVCVGSTTHGKCEQKAALQVTVLRGLWMLQVDGGTSEALCRWSRVQLTGYWMEPIERMQEANRWHVPTECLLLVCMGLRAWLNYWTSCWDCLFWLAVAAS